MTTWSEGYTTEVNYPAEYFRELNPLAARLAFLNARLALPDRQPEFACELGFGYGVSANVHAIASDCEWWGTDFNPTQARFARELSEASQSGARLFDDTFADFCHRPDLPEFDFIGLHGVWSWISDENRRLIVDFVRRRLRVGGVLYISYNTQPGWAQMVPMRQLLLEHFETMSAPGLGTNARIDAAVNYVDEVLEASPGFVALQPGAHARVKSLKTHDRSYLAHEYFNRDWHPMLFAEFARCWQPAKINFGCSALYSDHFDEFNLQPGQIPILAKIGDVSFRESVRDVMVNRQFRKDYWIKGPRQMEASERLAALRRQSVLLVSDPATIVLTAGGSLVPRALQAELYLPVIELLGDRKVRTLAQIEEELQGRNIAFESLVGALMVLSNKGDLVSAQTNSASPKVLAKVERYNRHVLENATTRWLASPVTGGGEAISVFHAQFLFARMQGLETPEQWAVFVWDRICANAKGLLNKDGSWMSAQEALGSLEADARSFAATQLPRLQSLGIAR